jgi:hypothetical protein
MGKIFATPREVPDSELVLLVDPLNSSLTTVIPSDLAKKLVSGFHAGWASGSCVHTDRGKRNMRIARLKKSSLRGCSAIMSPRHPKHGPDSGFYRGYLDALCEGNDKRRHVAEEFFAGCRGRA